MNAAKCVLAWFAPVLCGCVLLATPNLIRAQAPGGNDPPPTDPGTMPPGNGDPGTTPPGSGDPGTTPPGNGDPGTTPPGTPGTDPEPTIDPFMLFLQEIYDACLAFAEAEFPDASPEFQNWVAWIVFDHFFGDMLIEYLFGGGPAAPTPGLMP